MRTVVLAVRTANISRWDSSTSLSHKKQELSFMILADLWSVGKGLYSLKDCFVQKRPGLSQNC
jgi:hypothetical protein